MIGKERLRVGLNVTIYPVVLSICVSGICKRRLRVGLNVTYVACDKVVKLESLLFRSNFVDVLAVEMHGLEGVLRNETFGHVTLGPERVDMLLAALEVTRDSSVPFFVHGVKLDETVDVTGIQDFVPVVDLDVRSGIVPDGNCILVEGHFEGIAQNLQSGNESPSDHVLDTRLGGGLHLGWDSDDEGFFGPLIAVGQNVHGWGARVDIEETREAMKDWRNGVEKLGVVGFGTLKERVGRDLFGIAVDLEEEPFDGVARLPSQARHGRKHMIRRDNGSRTGFLVAGAVRPIGSALLVGKRRRFGNQRWSLIVVGFVVVRHNASSCTDEQEMEGTRRVSGVRRQRAHEVVTDGTLSKFLQLIAIIGTLNEFGEQKKLLKIL